MPEFAKKKLNLALQGGGAHGAYAWGILDKLLEVNSIEIAGISATSAGSMNAIVLAQGLMEGGPEKARELLGDFWYQIGEAGKKMGLTERMPMDYWLEPCLQAPFNFFCFSEMIGVVSPYQFNPWNYHPIREILDSMIDFKAINMDKSLKIFICATNVKNGKIKIFHKGELSTDCILASACIPKLFQSVEIDNEYYWDGGYVGNPAIFPLIYETNIQDILLLNIVPLVRDVIPTHVIDIDTRLREISFNSSIMRELRAISFVTKLIDDNWIKDEYQSHLKRLYMHCIRADQDLLEFPVSSVYIPEWNFLKKLHSLGKNAAEKWLKENFQMVGKKSTLNFEEWL